ncbi:hypothetical protein SeseC_01828 [Streptococcus equi subsp. zooepidemicus ATCC 35246]|nr:hypothetical protein SeseC_01828 [Streptococcus equi subsp. zooepidemicus ATCC 35246]
MLVPLKPSKACKPRETRSFGRKLRLDDILLGIRDDPS